MRAALAQVRERDASDHDGARCVAAVPKRAATVYDLWMSATVADELVHGPEYVEENEGSGWIVARSP